MLTRDVREAIWLRRFEPFDLGALYLETADRERRSSDPRVIVPAPANPFIGAITIELDGLAGDRDASLIDALRRSGAPAAFNGQPLDAPTLAMLLRLALGAPAGTIDIYVLVKAVDTVAEGFYHCSPDGRRLHQVKRCAVDLRDFFADPTAAAAIVLVADVGRSWAYAGEGSWKLALLEAGRIAERLCLAAAALRRAAVRGVAEAELAADRIGTALHLQPRTQRPVYSLLIGAIDD